MGPFEWLLITFMASLVILVVVSTPQILREAFGNVEPSYRGWAPRAGRRWYGRRMALTAF